MPKTKQTNLVVRHFADRKRPCIVLEQGNQGIVIGTLRNTECEELWNRFMQNCFLSREMSDLFGELKGEGR